MFKTQLIVNKIQESDISKFKEYQNNENKESDKKEKNKSFEELLEESIRKEEDNE